MASFNNISNGILPGTVSGMALAVCVNIDTGDMVKTIVLAAIGATVSCAVTVLLKWLIKKFHH